MLPACARCGTRQALKGTGKGGKSSKGETRKIFTKDDPTNINMDASGTDGDDADGEAGTNQAEKDANAAAQVGKSVTLILS